MYAQHMAWRDFGLRLVLGRTSLLQLLYLYMKNCNYTVEPEINIFSVKKNCKQYATCQ